MTSTSTRTRRPALQRLPALSGEVISWPTTRVLPAVQGTLALDLAGDGPVDDAPPLLTVVPDVDDAGTTESAGRAMRARAARFSMAVVEVVAGDRPVTQLLRWVTAGVYDEVAALAGTVGRTTDADVRARTDRARLLSVHVYRLSDDVAEVCGHVRQGRRSRALALRLEHRRDRWVCTALQLG